jgi:hypothetical protein
LAADAWIHTPEADFGYSPAIKGEKLAFSTSIHTMRQGSSLSLKLTCSSPAGIGEAYIGENQPAAIKKKTAARR